MCFSQPASAAFALVGFGTAAFLRARGHPFRRYQLFVYFAVMEVIQFCAYFVVDQCDSPLNKLVTMLAYIHVMFQNMPVNLYFLSPEHGVHPDVTTMVLGMTFIGGAMGLLMKLPWPVWLGASPKLLDPLVKYLPEFYSYTTAGTPEACQFETMCADKICTFSTPNHIAWSVPLLPPSYFLPNGFLHFFFFFIPTWLMSNNTARLTMLAAMFSGPVLTQMLAAQYMNTYKFEWPATWCYMSVGQCFVALAAEFYSKYREENIGGKKKRKRNSASSMTDVDVVAAVAKKGHAKAA